MHLKELFHKKSLRDKLITLSIPVLAFLVMEIFSAAGMLSRHMQAMLIPICVNVILAVSLNLTVGFLGELTLGHAGFMSVGAYAGCLFSIQMQNLLPAVVRYPLALLIGGLVAAIFGLLIGIPVLRLKGDYLAIVTLAFGEIIRSVIINLDFLGGAAGLKGTPQDASFVSSFVVVMIMLIVVMNMLDSRQGRAVTAIRDNRIAAEACGLPVTYYKMLAFVVAAFFAGVAGVIYGHNLNILTASTFDYNKSIEILVIVVLGGMGSIRGSVIAAVLITVLPEALRSLDSYRMVIYALLLILIMLFNGSPRFETLRGKLNWKGLCSLLSRKNKDAHPASK